MKYVYQLPALKRSPLGPMLKCCSVNLYGLAIHIPLPLFYLPSSIFEVVSFFLILPVLLSPLQLVIYSVWWCCLFRFLQLFHADVYRVYCRLYFVVLNPSKSVELYIRFLTMMRDLGLCTFPFSAFQKKSLKVLPPFVVCWWPLYSCFLLSAEAFAAVLPPFENLAPPPCLSE